MTYKALIRPRIDPWRLALGFLAAALLGSYCSAHAILLQRPPPPAAARPNAHATAALGGPAAVPRTRNATAAFPIRPAGAAVAASLNRSRPLAGAPPKRGVVNSHAAPVTQLRLPARIARPPVRSVRMTGALARPKAVPRQGPASGREPAPVRAPAPAP